MGNITKSTRRESYRALTRDTIYNKIVEVLEAAAEPLTARQISEHMHVNGLIHYPVRQAVAPRLTELTDRGAIQVSGKVYDRQTKRNVAAYKLVEVQP